MKQITNHRRLAANDGAMLANAAEGGAPFAILQDDSFFIPYGEFPHKKGLQQFDRAAAEEMVANHKSALSRLVRWARGQSQCYPVYVGHPDLPGTKDTDKRAYGWIDNMVAETEGLRLPVKWSHPGREMVENAHYKYYSPLWWFRPTKTGIRPVALKSMGLTNDPNIPVPALANEREEESNDKENEQMNPEILAALGLEAGATADDVLAAILKMQAAAPAEEAAPEEAEEMKNLKAENETVTAELAVTRGNLNIAANAAVQAAVAAGRITPAEAKTKAAEILAANDFQAALDGLGKLPPKFKTTSATGDLGAAKSSIVLAANDEHAAAREERARLVANEFEATNPEQSLGERKRIAWRRAQAKNPELFGKKESPGAAA